ncbi:uncharacterized protein N7515_005940 [Penicillium bovifimosum]|uniref:DUF6590 domain-containing protein n=1 Tax=Penicillium bovifimosum TaxID=126998 RepID=A0A9W9GU12_9EURO|nr:uncharacterized protein N7515_005940 [Penicillium bovifimosum]KAJ5129901.1 hypothetical protein N7515_005940 [Penicillium bovifimosum]
MALTLQEFNLEYNRWIRSLNDSSGNLYYTWDQSGGSWTAATTVQGSSIPVRQSPSTPTSSKPNDAYGHRAPFPGVGRHASRPDAQRPGRQGHSTGYPKDQRESNSRLPDAGHQKLANVHRVDSGIYLQERTGRKAGRASVSEGSDTTSSSRSESSDASMSQISIESLADQPASAMVLAHKASSSSHRNDPIPGDLRQRYEMKVQKSSLEPSYVITGSGCNRETLDPRYTRQASKYFKVGKVFAMLWHENAGSNGTILSEKAQASPFTKGKFQEPIYSSIRRMIVVKEQRGCCWCVPVLTYGGQGVAKAGIDRNKHAIIHMRGDKPRVQRGEPRMVKEPLEVVPAKFDSKLDCMSRVNFGKIYTVEHNVKVFPVGKISEASRLRFLEYARSEFL